MVEDFVDVPRTDASNMSVADTQIYTRTNVTRPKNGARRLQFAYVSLPLQPPILQVDLGRGTIRSLRPGCLRLDFVLNSLLLPPFVAN